MTQGIPILTPLADALEDVLVGRFRRQYAMVVRALTGASVLLVVVAGALFLSDRAGLEAGAYGPLLSITGVVLSLFVLLGLLQFLLLARAVDRTAEDVTEAAAQVESGAEDVTKAAREVEAGAEEVETAAEDVETVAKEVETVADEVETSGGGPPPEATEIGEQAEQRAGEAREKGKTAKESAERARDVGEQVKDVAGEAKEQLGGPDDGEETVDPDERDADEE